MVVALAGVLALTGVAFAEDGGDEPVDADTGLNYAYDERHHLLVLNLWDLDLPEGQVGYDCSLTANPYDATYAEGDGEHLVVDTLTNEAGEITFEAIGGADGEEPIEPLAYASDNECGLRAVDVTGPNGQVNHGMFMKAWNELWDGGPGRGCLNRHLARSDLGKGDQQVTVDEAREAGPLDDPLATIDATELTFETILADCDRGSKGRDRDQSDESRGNGNGNGRGHGKPDHGEADGEPGNDRGNGRGNDSNGNGRGRDR